MRLNLKMHPYEFRNQIAGQLKKESVLLKLI